MTAEALLITIYLVSCVICISAYTLIKREDINQGGRVSLFDLLLGALLSLTPFINSFIIAIAAGVLSLEALKIASERLDQITIIKGKDSDS